MSTLKIEEKHINELIKLLEEQTNVLFKKTEAQQAAMDIVRYVLIREIRGAQQTTNNEGEEGAKSPQSNSD